MFRLKKEYRPTRSLRLVMGLRPCSPSATITSSYPNGYNNYTGSHRTAQAICRNLDRPGGMRQHPTYTDAVSTCLSMNSSQPPSSKGWAQLCGRGERFPVWNARWMRPRPWTCRVRLREGKPPSASRPGASGIGAEPPHISRNRRKCSGAIDKLDFMVATRIY